MFMSAETYGRCWVPWTNKEKQREYNLRYREENGEKLAAYQRQYYLANRDERLAQMRLYELSNQEQRKKYLTERYSDARAYVNELKTEPCLDCGGSFPPECMDFDHVRGEKEFALGGANVSRSRESVDQEIAKCDLVCANCHRIRTEARRLQANG